MPRPARHHAARRRRPQNAQGFRSHPGRVERAPRADRAQRAPAGVARRALRRMPEPYDVIVIGAGITGLTASKLLAQRGFRVANLEGALFGGLVTNVNALD